MIVDPKFSMLQVLGMTHGLVGAIHVNSHGSFVFCTGA